MENLLYGFSVAITPMNLLYCFAGAFLGTLDYKAQLDAWGKLQEAVYSQVPFIKFGDYHRLHMATSEKYIKGLGTATHPNQDHVYAYDLWLP